MGNQMLENLKAFLETDEGKESIERWGEKLRRADEHKDRWAEKFKQRCESDIDGSIEKLLAKYDSKEYRDKEYGKGREPSEGHKFNIAKISMIVLGIAIAYFV